MPTAKIARTNEVAFVLYDADCKFWMKPRWVNAVINCMRMPLIICKVDPDKELFHKN